jgi:ATP-binding cassette subfamily F protein 3
VKEHLCDIEEFMELRKVERLNELDLDKKDKKQEMVATPKAVVKEDPQIKQKEEEQKQLKSQIKKAEENITRLESEIKLCNDKLADAAEFEKLMNDKTFFTQYEKLKKDLEMEMQRWEELSSKLL